jgi:ubiquitin-protein ligase
VKSDGQICTLGFPWAPQNKAQDYLLLVRQLLEHPSDEDPLEPTIGNEYKNNHPKFVKRAKEWTAKHAK